MSYSVYEVLLLLSTSVYKPVRSRGALQHNLKRYNEWL